MFTQNYVNKTYMEENNLKHRFKVQNVTKSKDISEYLENDDIDIAFFIENEVNAISPNNVALTFYPPNPDDLSKIKYEYFDEADPKLYFDDIDGKYYFDNFEDGITENFIDKFDEIEVIDIFAKEENVIFTGIAKNISFKREHMKDTLEVEIKDRTIKGYLNKFDKDYFYQGFYFYNSNYKNQSLLYILAKEMGFDDNKINIEEIKYSDGNYITVPSTDFKKNSKVMDEMAELVRAIKGSIYVTQNGTLKITSLFNQEDTEILDYKFKYGNVLSFLQINEEEPDNNKIEVTFTEFKVEDEQPVFVLAGQNYDKTADDAKVTIKANTVGNNDYWKIKFLTDRVVNLNPVPEVKAYIIKPDLTKEYINYLEYDLKLEDTGGKVKFSNSLNQDIFLEKFKILGQPIKSFDGSNVTYTEKPLAENQVELLTVSNKYVQEMRLAQELAMYSYFTGCRKSKRYKLKINNAYFLELDQVVELDFMNFKKKLQLKKLSFKRDYIEVEAIEYEEFKPDKEYYYSERSSYFDETYLNNAVIDFGDIQYPTDKPSTPINLRPENNFLGIGASWTKVNRDDIQNYMVYVKGLNEDGTYTGFETSFSTGTSNNFLASMNAGLYEIKVSCMTVAGVESDKTTAVIARAMAVDGDQLNIDGDTVVVDTGTKKLVLGTVYARNISADSILANHITAGAIETKHIKADAVTTDKIRFGSGDAIQKGSNGIEVRLLNGNSLDIVGLLNVYSKAGLIVYNSTTEANSTKRVIIQGGGVFLQERAP